MNETEGRVVIEDPLVRSARREALFCLAMFVLALAYTIGYCALYGYGREPATMRFFWGVPDWVLWGIAAPWCVCVAVSSWFAFAFMTDEDLGEAAGAVLADDDGLDDVLPPATPASQGPAHG